MRSLIAGVVLLVLGFPEFLRGADFFDQPPQPLNPGYLIQNKIKYSFQAFGGPSFSNIDYPGIFKVFDIPHINPEPREAYVYGVGAGIEFTPHFGFSMDFCIEKKGTRFDFVEKTLSTTDLLWLSTHTQTQIKSTYLSVPLMIRFTGGRNVKVFAEAGPYLSFLLQSKTNLDAEGTKDVQGIPMYFHNQYSVNTFRNIHPIDHGATAGVGIMFPVHRVKFGPVTYLFIQGRGSWGMADVGKPEEYLSYPVIAPAFSFPGSAYNFFWHLNLGLRMSMF
jgi:hypothetical protein